MIRVVIDDTRGRHDPVPGEWVPYMWLEFKWDAADRFWVNSSDVGVIAYSPGVSGWTALLPEEQHQLKEPHWEEHDGHGH
jgi:hypothetical protein